MNQFSEPAKSKPISLYWWNGKPNFGDCLSKVVVELLSGQEVIWSSPSECELFALGSIMRLVRRAYASPNQNLKPWVWGTGCMGPHKRDFVENVHFAIVRGPLTASLLDLEMEEFGDPGLLISDLLSEPIRKDGRIGFIPHLSQINSPKVLKALEGTPRLKLIDVRNDDALTVVREIASCDYVLSSSLHGLIVADSFGIPNTWMQTNGLHQTPKFKFYDYALSVGRVLSNPIKFEEVNNHIEDIKFEELNYQNGIDVSKAALVRTFPAALVR